MARTVRRQTFSVPASSKNYSQSGYFNQVQFKGLCTNQNDVTIDSQSFADVNNMLVDENGVLTSRPAFKFENDEGYIVDEWTFGSYHLRMYRLLYRETTDYHGNTESVERPVKEGISTNEYTENYYYVYFIRCVSHIATNEYRLALNLSSGIGSDWVPDVTCLPIVNKIYIWFGGIDFVVFNITELTFVDGANDVYYPIHELITNGFTSELESKNFLTDVYKRRYLYSLMSSVDFSKLQGRKDIRVSLSGNTNENEYLYDIEHWGEGQTEDLLIYPYSYIGKDMIIDVVSTINGNVYLRYDTSTQRIEVSFDGKTFRRLPALNKMVGIPQLTKDGFDVMAFTQNGLARCRIAMSSASDTNELFVWSIQTYGVDHNAIVNICGHFETANDYVFMLKDANYIFVKAQYGSLMKVATISYGSEFYIDFANDVKPLLLYIPPTGTTFTGDQPYLIVFVPYVDNNKMTSLCFFFAEAIVMYTKDVFDEMPSAQFISTSDAYIAGYRRFIDESEEGGQIADMEIYIPTVLNINESGIRKDVRRTISIIIRVSKNFSADISIGGNSATTQFISDTKYIRTKKVFLGEQKDVALFTTLVADYLTEKYYVLDGHKYNLPTTGKLSNNTRRVPLLWDSTGIIYNIDGYLWLSQLMPDTVLELDEWINVDASKVNFEGSIPTSFATMNEHYFTFVSERRDSFLEVTSTRYNNDDFLLYLPKINEQRFMNEITALHPLSNTEIGVFTEDEIWYVSNVIDDSGNVAYTKPVKSKLPFGCRKGSEVITALDGQAIIFPTTRGVAALAPQDFIATTEKTLSYLSDNIQSRYEDFYNKSVFNTGSGELIECKPFIKITVYKYWVLFYKYLSRDILVFDTRSGTWWNLTTSYPIRKITITSNLNVLMQIDYLSSVKKTSLLGVSFKFDNDNTYRDDIVKDTLRGDAHKIVDNGLFGERYIFERASSNIDWQFTSQRLHFDQINNYKAIKAINMNLRGEDVNAKLYTKAYRDLYHPEQDDVVEIKMNELCTFVKRFNILHVTNFQYRIENDLDVETPHQFQLNSLSIKYEVKERVR